MICVKITLIQISTQNIIARHPLAFKGLRGKRPKKWDNSAEKCGEKKGTMFHVKHRRRGLRIIRFRASAKAHPLRRTSSSTENRFAGFSVDFRETRGVPLPRLLPPQPRCRVAEKDGKRNPRMFHMKHPGVFNMDLRSLQQQAATNLIFATAISY